MYSSDLSVLKWHEGHVRSLANQNKKWFNAPQNVFDLICKMMIIQIISVTDRIVAYLHAQKNNLYTQLNHFVPKKKDNIRWVAVEQALMKWGSLVSCTDNWIFLMWKHLAIAHLDQYYCWSSETALQCRLCDNLLPKSWNKSWIFWWRQPFFYQWPIA